MDMLKAERILKAMEELRTFIVQGPDTLTCEEFKNQAEKKMEELDKLFDS